MRGMIFDIISKYQLQVSVTASRWKTDRTAEVSSWGWVWCTL